MTVIKAETTPYLEAFRALSRPAGEPRWLTGRREAALARFAELGFPTRRQESWRFNDLRVLQRCEFPPSAAGGAAAWEKLERRRFAGDAHRLVLVDGRFMPDLSDIGTLPEGVWLGSTAVALAERPALVEAALGDSDISGAQPFSSLNAAFFADGFVLSLPRGVTLDRPVEVMHLAGASAPRSLHLRSVVMLGTGSAATLLETFAGEGVYWTNAVTALHLDERAILRHVKVQDEGQEAVHFAAARATLGRAARYASFVLTVGGRLSRHDTLAAVTGEGAQLGLDGAYMLRGEQEATNATFVDHAAPAGSTREVFKGVIEERAHGIFLGKIAVRPEAQKTNAHQINRNLLLSPRAVVDTKPELEIFADDVRCSHGATVGELEEAALFYLRSRGIPMPEARRMLIEAFIADALETVEEAALHAYLRRHVERWLANRGE